MEYIFLIIILIFSVIIHEIAHGSVAYYLGDPTAKYAGRLTLNPLKHLDPVGSVIVPVFLAIAAQLTGGGIIFGWAKPVPVNPYNFKDQKYGSLKVSLAGPLANLALAVVFGLVIRFVPLISQIEGLTVIFSYIVYINILLAVFNLIPIPPLDGSHILFTFLPYSMQNLKIALHQFGIVILAFIIIFGFPVLIRIINLIFMLITGFSLLT